MRLPGRCARWRVASGALRRLQTLLIKRIWARRANLSLAAVYARTRTPATPPPATDRPRGSSHDGHTSSGDTDGDVEVDVDGSNDR